MILVGWSFLLRRNCRSLVLVSNGGFMNHDPKYYKDNPYNLASIERERELAIQEAASNHMLDQFKPKAVFSTFSGMPNKGGDAGMKAVQVFERMEFDRNFTQIMNNYAYKGLCGEPIGEVVPENSNLSAELVAKYTRDCTKAYELGVSMRGDK